MTKNKTDGTQVDEDMKFSEFFVGTQEEQAVVKRVEVLQRIGLESQSESRVSRYVADRQAVAYLRLRQWSIPVALVIVGISMAIDRLIIESEQKPAAALSAPQNPPISPRW